MVAANGTPMTKVKFFKALMTTLRPGDEVQFQVCVELLNYSASRAAILFSSVAVMFIFLVMFVFSASGGQEGW